MENQSEIIIYQTEDGLTHIEVKFENETVWLSQQQMADQYQTSRTNVIEYIKHIYEEGELDEQSTCRNFRQVRQEGGREVTRNIPFYNLDMIISLEYRVKSSIVMRFRRWVTERLQLDAILLSENKKLLVGYGNVSHDQTVKKAKAEYRKYQKNTLSPVEQAYM